ncbi:ADP-ribosylglycohydrolase family protein [Dermabacteraceae bacterium P13264]
MKSFKRVKIQIFRLFVRDSGRRRLRPRVRRCLGLRNRVRLVPRNHRPPAWPPSPLVVSYDTQMSLYTLLAIRRILPWLDGADLAADATLQQRVRVAFADKYLDFFQDPDNNRAPGQTVMRALLDYSRSPKTTGVEGSLLNDNKGCGTIMCAPWLSLLNLTEPIIAWRRPCNPKTTHDHPAATLSAATAAIIYAPAAAL